MNTLKDRDIKIAGRAAKAGGTMSEETNIAVLEHKISSMSDDIAHIRDAIDALTQTFSRLAVMEERNNGHKEAIDRAFDEIARVEKSVSNLEEKVNNDRDRTNRWIYGLCGVALAVSALWAILGFAVRFIE